VPVTSETVAPIAITTSFSLKGPLDLAQLKGDGETTISFPSLVNGLPLSGTSSLKDGLLKVSLPNSTYGGAADLNVDFTGTRGGKLVVKLPSQKTKNFLGDDDECGSIGGALVYSFPLAAPLNGTGELSLSEFSLGCQPYGLTIPARTTIPIKAGALSFNDLTISSLDSALALNGEVGISRGFDLSAKGRLQLSSLIPLLPSVDDIQGALRADMTIKGPLSSPAFSGSADLTNGEFGLSSPDVGAHNVRGKFTMTGSHIRIETLSGSVNNGTFSIKGSLLPFDWANSDLTADLQEVTIEPVRDSSITFSGGLRLGLGPTKRQMLAGDILINFAEVSKDFDLNKILLNAISGYFLPARIQPVTAKKKVDIDLDVNLSAPRNIFVITPFFSAELDTNLKAAGTISDPSLVGSMQVLSGWVGLKGNRFDITSGAVTFKPGSLVPTIELASEGTLRAPTGDSVLVILDASGPLPNPKIELSSDRGLSQGELLLLLTSSRRLGGSTEANQLGGQLGSDQRFFMSGDSFSSLRAFWRNLTRIDTLSFEPAYNQFTGTIEPAVVAKKNLSPRLALLGESLFSSVSNSRAGAVYSLTPKLNVNAFFQTVSTQRNSIISSDLTYTILSEQAEFVTFSIEGLTSFSEENILSAARLGAASRVLNTPDGLRSIERQILNYMMDQGYRDSAVQARCVRGERYCNELKIIVVEGSPSTISSIVFEGDKLPNNLDKLVHDLAPLGSPATATIANTIEQKTVVALRGDGYISARITPTYRATDTPGHAILVVSADIREPISFIFNGNKVFSAEDFLNSIDLFSRKRAFGNNTIKLLTQNIEQMYQESGYLFVNVSYTEDRSDPTRLVYHVQIREEAPTKVGSLTLSGNSQLSRERIIHIMNDIGLSEQIRLFNPPYAVPAELDTLRDAISTVYQEEGFPQVAVTYEVSPIASDDRLSIDFSIAEGAPVRTSKLIVEGYPRELTVMPLPATPISIPRVNAYAEQVIENIRNEGYLFPSVTLEPSEDLSTITVTIESGERTSVSSISYEGLLTIAEDTARKATVLKAGAAYRAEDVNQTKRNLLRTGLFSRVEVLAHDNNFDTPSEAVVIRLVERPLETLEVGGGANSEFGLHTFGEAVNKSYFADGRTLSLRVDTYFDQGFINPNGSGLISQGFTSARYQDPTFLDSEYSLTEEVRYQRQELSTQEFNLDRLLFGSYVFRRYDSGVTLSAGHSLMLDNLQDVTPGAIISDLDDGSVRLSFLSSVMRLDRRDDSILPRSGYTLNLEPKLSLVGIGSEANFASMIARSTAIVPLSFVSPRYTMGLGLSGGLSQPWGDTTEIPITQRFYLGGRTTVRGFRENSLGPRGSDGAVIGGDTMLASKTELQYLVADSFSTHVFLDAGNVFLRHEDFDLADIRTSTGIGFQYLSPIGPIGFDVGHPLDERSGEPSVRLHFSVGSLF
jgi:outer membrane protein insertion porin family